MPINYVEWRCEQNIKKKYTRDRSGTRTHVQKRACCPTHSPPLSILSSSHPLSLHPLTHSRPPQFILVTCLPRHASTRTHTHTHTYSLTHIRVYISLTHTLSLSFTASRVFFFFFSTLANPLKVKDDYDGFCDHTRYFMFYQCFVEPG